MAILIHFQVHYTTVPFKYRALLLVDSIQKLFLLEVLSNQQHLQLTPPVPCSEYYTAQQICQNWMLYCTPGLCIALLQQ